MKEKYERIKRIAKTYLDKFGYEKPDPVPVAPPLGHTPTPPIEDLIRSMITSHMLRAEAEAAGMETFEEANDFYVEDDTDPYSPYEDDVNDLGPEVVPPTREQAEVQLKQLQDYLDKLPKPSPAPEPPPPPEGSATTAQ